MFVRDLWNPLARSRFFQIHREFAEESLAQSLLKLLEDMDEIVPERDRSENNPDQKLATKCQMGMGPKSK
jgi:hypothetical protein